MDRVFTNRLRVAVLLTSLAPVHTLAAESDSSRVYGTWRWTETYHGTFSIGNSFPEVCECERFLTFAKDGTYKCVERDSTNEYVLGQGTFRISRVSVGPVDQRHPYWLHLHPGLKGGGYDDDQCVSLLGDDTLRLVDCGSGGEIVTDGGSSSFTRERSHRTRPIKPQLPLSKRPPRSDIAAEVDTNLTHAPVLLDHVSPEYPDSLRNAGVGGKVELEVLVGRDGAVKKVRTIQSGTATLDQLATRAVRRWTFRPYGGPSNPQSVWIRIAVDFPP